MLIGKKYQLKSDTMQYTLSEKKINKKKQTEYWEPIGYFSNPVSALKYLVNHAVKETELTDLKTVVNRMEEIHKEIMEAQNDKR